MFDFDGNPGELLDHEFAAQSGVAAGSAGHNGDAAQGRDFRGCPRKTVGADGAAEGVNMLRNGVADGIRLLIDLRQHLERKNTISSRVGHGQNSPG
jgi:hypothetical protein